MKCSKIEKDIYLYDALEPYEREQVDEHVTTCAPCMNLLNAVRDMHKVVALNQSETPILHNHAAMTRRIMDAVQATQRRKHPQLKEALHRIMVAPLRYHMAVLSVVLVMFFIKEHGDGIEHTKSFNRHPRVLGPKTELNLAAFHTVFFETKKGNNQSSSAIADCVVRCLDAPTSDCKACAEKYTKP